jgi:hypothetical protein
MYGGFDVFKTYLAVKLHFTTDSYDYHKYSGEVNCTLDTFTKRNDRYFFHKLSTRYGKDDILGFFVSNFLVDSNKWVKSLTNQDGKDVFTDWKKRNESFEYHFRNDCITITNDFNTKQFSFDNGFSVFGGQHPRFFQLVLSKKISYETAIVFNKILSYSKSWDKQIVEQVVWPIHSKRIKKYTPFVRYNETQCKLIMKEVFINGS